MKKGAIPFFSVLGNRKLDNPGKNMASMNSAHLLSLFHTIGGKHKTKWYISFFKDFQELFTKSKHFSRSWRRNSFSITFSAFQGSARFECRFEKAKCAYLRPRAKTEKRHWKKQNRKFNKPFDMWIQNITFVWSTVSVCYGDVHCKINLPTFIFWKQ